MGAKTLLTAAEFERLTPEEGVRRELDEGELREMTFPNVRHNRLVGRIFRLLSEFVERNSLGEVFAPDTGFVLSRDPDTLRGPDVSFLTPDRVARIKPDQSQVEGAPDLAVEVVSPSDSAQDVDKKVRQYLAAGGKIVWVVYPLTEHVMVYEADGSVRRLSEGQTLEAPELLPGFSVPVKDLFTTGA